MLAELSRSFKVIRTSLTIWWNDWLPLATLNLGWILCLLTLVLGPPATFAIYRAAHMSVNRQDIYFRELVLLLRHDLLKSWLWLLVNLLITMVIWLNLQFYTQFNAGWTVGLQFILLLIGALWFALQVYALPYLIEQKSFSLRQAFRNALFTVLASPVYSVVLICFVGFLVYAGIRFMFLFFLGLPCLVAVLGTCAVKERLETFGVRQGDKADRA